MQSVSIFFIFVVDHTPGLRKRTLRDNLIVDLMTNGDCSSRPTDSLSNDNRPFSINVLVECWRVEFPRLFFVLAIPKLGLFSGRSLPSPVRASLLLVRTPPGYIYISVSVKVNGERNPTEVYSDFRSSVLQILSAHRTSVPVIVSSGNHTAPVIVPSGNHTAPVQHSDDGGGGGGVERPDHGDDDDGAGRRPTDRDADPPLAGRDTDPLPAGQDAERDARRRPDAKTAGDDPQPTKYPTVVCVVGECGKNNIFARESRVNSNKKF